MLSPTPPKQHNTVGLIFYYQLLEVIAFATKIDGTSFTTKDIRRHCEFIGVNIGLRTVQRMVKNLKESGVFDNKSEARYGILTNYTARIFNYQNPEYKNINNPLLPSICDLLAILELGEMTSKDVVYMNPDKPIHQRKAQRLLNKLHKLKVLDRHRTENGVSFYYLINPNFHGRIKHLLKAQ